MKFILLSRINALSSRNFDMKKLLPGRSRQEFFTAANIGKQKKINFWISADISSKHQENIQDLWYYNIKITLSER